jgi:tyrosyl-tRNA synthetase
MVSGVELIRRKTGHQAYALSWPLLTDASGRKFGKSEGGAVWLDAAKTSAFQFYQFWFNLGDEGIEEYLKKMTLLSLDEISLVMERHAKEPAARAAQTALAWEATALVHGEKEADKAEEVSTLIFKGSAGDLSAEALKTLKGEAPSANIKLGLPVVDALVETKLASSKREARQFLDGGAVMLGDEKITDMARVLEEKDFTNGIALLRRGKRNVSVLVLD